MAKSPKKSTKADDIRTMAARGASVVKIRNTLGVTDEEIRNASVREKKSS